MTFGYTAWKLPASTLSRATTIYRPMVPLTVRGSKDRFITISSLVDTGADHTLLPTSVGKEANVEGHINDAPVKVLGFGGQQLTVLTGYVQLELTDGAQKYSWTTTVGFVMFDRPEDELAVVGHGAFLEYFLTTFDPIRHQVTITPNEMFPGSISGSEAA